MPWNSRNRKGEWPGYRSRPRCGTTDSCEWCRDSYTVKTPWQKYCSPACAQMARLVRKVSTAIQELHKRTRQSKMA